MKKLNEKRAIAEYDKGKDSLIRMFLMKQGFEENGEPFEYEFIDAGKSIVCVCDYYINIDDIYSDMILRCEKGEILKWYDYNLVACALGYKFVNYHSYLNGYRHKKNKFKEFIYVLYTECHCFWYKLCAIFKKKEWEKSK